MILQIAVFDDQVYCRSIKLFFFLWNYAKITNFEKQIPFRIPTILTATSADYKWSGQKGDGICLAPTGNSRTTHLDLGTVC